MKILIVVTKSELGGAQVVVLNLARGLKARGLDVSVAGGPGEYLPEELKKNGISFYRFKNLERSYNPFKVLKFISELKEYVKREKFTTVHLNSTNALFGVWGLTKLDQKPKIIFTVHGLSFLDPNYQTNFLFSSVYKLFFKLAWKKVNNLVFVSRLNYLNALSRGLAKKGEVIYNGLNLPDGYFLDSSEARRILGEKIGVDLSNSYIYGSIGRLACPKNYEFLINTYNEIKKIKPLAKLLIIGEGPDRAKYETLIKSYRLEREVYLLGEIKEASRYLKAFDLFVLPSIFEGMSLSLMEARAAGVSVLASHVGGNEEVVGIENCFKLNDLADFLKKLSTKKNQTNLSDFSIDKMIEAYLNIYI